MAPHRSSRRHGRAAARALAFSTFGIVTACGQSVPAGWGVPAGWIFVTGVGRRSATVVWAAAGDEPMTCRSARGSQRVPTVDIRLPGVRSIRLDGLAPATEYVCSVAPRDSRPLRVRFRSAPRYERSYTFAVVGDSGDGSATAARLARRILAGRPAFLLHLGGIAYRPSYARPYD